MHPAPDPLRARHHPLAIGLYFGFQLALSLLISIPWAAVLAQGVNRYPQGDRLLFQAGGELLLETLRMERGVLSALWGATLWQLPLVFLLSLWATAGLMVSLASSEPAHWTEWVARSLRCVPHFLALGAASILLRGVLFVVFMGMGSTMNEALASAENSRTGDLAQFGFLAIAGVSCAVVSATEDLARAAVVSHQFGPIRAVAHLRVLNQPGRWHLLLDWLVPAVASLALLLLTSVGARSFPLENGSGEGLLAVLALQQASMLGQVAWKANWLAAALRRVR